MRKKIVLTIAAVVLLLAVGAVVAIGPRNIIGMLLYDQRREGNLVVGDQAPNVALGSLDDGRLVQLSEFVGGMPLVLVFGSFT